MLYIKCVLGRVYGMYCKAAHIVHHCRCESYTQEELVFPQGEGDVWVNLYCINSDDVPLLMTFPFSISLKS